MRKFYDAASMSNAEYHAKPDISSSDLKRLIATDPHYWKHVYPNETKKPAPAFDFGTAMHTVLLEPDTVNDTIIVVPDDVRRGTKDWKARERENATLIKQSDWDSIERLAESVYANDDAMAILKESAKELSVFWEEDGIACKARCDAILADVVADVKTCGSLKHFAKDVHDYHYPLQAAHYLAGFEKPFFYFVAIEKKPPYGCQVFELSESWLDEGKRMRAAMLKLYTDCTKNDDWPRHTYPTMTIEKPHYLKDFDE